LVDSAIKLENSGKKNKGQENYVKPMKRVCDVIYSGETACETYVEMVAYLIKTNAQKKKSLQE